jgi:cyclase
VRKALSGSLFLFLIFSAHSLLAQQDFSKVEVHVQKVNGSVYMLTGAGGNVAICVSDNGLLMVDTEFPEMSEKIEAALQKLSDKPLRFVIDTHWHGDHVGGNANFRKRGALIIAQENVRRILASGTMRDGRKYEPAPPEALPQLTYEERATVYLDGEEVRLIHVPHAHTDGDTVVYFTNSHVLDLGDDYRTDGFPLVDEDNGGTVKGMIAALDGVMKEYPPDTKVIPGHGPDPMTVADIKSFADMLRDCRARVEKGIEQGKTLEQLKQEKVLAGYESYSKRVTSDRFIEVLYGEITREKNR